MFQLVRPLVHALPPEAAHRLTIRALSMMPARRPRAFDPVLESRVAGLVFPSPVGLAAGFDKDAEAADAMLALGFGSVEVGTLTPQPQAGNAKPRLFRLAEDRAVINRFGFNNRGQGAALERLRRRERRGILGVNVGANKDAADRIADYADGVRAMAPVADYLTINISSPNTPGLRALQTKAALADLLAAVREARSPGGPPVFLKVAPDLEEGEPEAIVETAITHGIDALIVSNTTVTRPALRSPHAGEAGGLSGAPLAPLARDALARFAAVAGGRLPLVSAGGIGDADEAYARILAGASLVQLYSALVYEGPGLARRIASGIAGRLARDGFASLGEAVGAGSTSTRPSRRGS